jgi:hypothetical protein
VGIMSDEEKPYIFESPDGGITVRIREMGDYENTITISHKELKEYQESSDSVVNPDWFNDQSFMYGNIKPNYKTNALQYPDFDLHDEYVEVKQAYERYLEIEERYRAWNYIKNGGKK